jgi:hypothetical protein
MRKSKAPPSRKEREKDGAPLLVTDSLGAEASIDL